MSERIDAKTSKRYKALRKIVRGIKRSKHHVIIPGVEIGPDGSQRVYVELRRYYGTAHPRFYFYSRPCKQEVEQIIDMMKVIAKETGW